MSSSQHDAERRQKLEEIRKRLLGDLTREQLEHIQLHLSLIATWDRLMAEDPGHHHDHMEDHDHTALLAPAVDPSVNPAQG